MRSPILKSLLIFTAVYAVAFPGALAINSAVGFWYITLTKPIWAPPNWLLVPLWLVVYALLAGAITAFTRSVDEQPKGLDIALVFVTALIGTGWAATCFFGHRFVPALVVICLAVLTAIIATVRAWGVSATAGRCLFFASAAIAYFGVLTTVLWRLNP